MHEKTLNITNIQRNANQTHNELSPYICRTAIIKKMRDNGTGKDVEKRELLCTVVGN